MTTTQPKIVVLRTERFDNYWGPENDQSRNMSWSRDNPELIPCEAWNFEPIGDDVYGYVRIAQGNSLRAGRIYHGAGIPWASAEINQVAGVLVVWVAPHPAGGDVVYGWWEDADVFRHVRYVARLDEGTPWEQPFHVKALAWNTRLLQVNRRKFLLPTGRGGMGQSNDCYLLDAPHVRKQLLDYVTSCEQDGSCFMEGPQ